MVPNLPLGPLTTLQIGGPARYFAEAGDEQQLVQLLAWAKQQGERLFILGGGSNLLVADEGFPGLVVKIAFRGIERRGEGGSAIYEVGAGEDWDPFVARTVLDGCAGIENLSGIPGTVGGTPVQNVGAYGQEVSETIVSVTVLDRTTGEVKTMSNEQCGFAYRTSVFNSSQRDRYVVLRVTYRLQQNGAPDLKYADLQKHFVGKPKPSLAQVREAVRQIRLSKAMLIVPGDEDCRSAGSFFKNPIVTLKKVNEVNEIARRRGIDRQPPSYAAGTGLAKLSAAWLVEQSGFHKGYGQGPAGISRRHALAIVNRGGAKAKDVIALKDEVQRGVKDTFGVELQPEPVFVGFGDV